MTELRLVMVGPKGHAASSGTNFPILAHLCQIEETGTMCQIFLFCKAEILIHFIHVRYLWNSLHVARMLA